MDGGFAELAEPDEDAGEDILRIHDAALLAHVGGVGGGGTAADVERLAVIIGGARVAVGVFGRETRGAESEREIDLSLLVDGIERHAASVEIARGKGMLKGLIGLEAGDQVRHIQVHQGKVAQCFRGVGATRKKRPIQLRHLRQTGRASSRSSTVARLK